MKFAMKSALAALALAVSVAGPACASVQEQLDRLYKNADPEALFVKSFRSPSANEKAEIRAYLAKHYPDTPSGIASRAWLAAIDGDLATSQKLYESCIQRAPDFDYCKYNLAADQTYGNKRRAALYAALAGKDPLEKITTAHSDLYILYMNENDAHAAQSVLDDAQARYGQTYLPHYLRALGATYVGNWELASKELDQAIELGAQQIELYAKAADVRRRLATGSSSEGVNEALDVYDAFDSYLQEHAPDRADLRYKELMAVAALLDNNRGRLKQEFESLNKAYLAYPTAEAAVKMIDLMTENRPADSEAYRKAQQFAEAVYERLPTQRALLLRMAHLYIDTGALGKADDMMAQALEASYTNSARITTVVDRAESVWEDGQFDYARAQAEYNRLLKSIDPANPEYPNLYNALYFNRLEIGDFAAALQALDQFEAIRRKRGDINEHWFGERRVRLQHYLAERGTPTSRANAAAGQFPQIGGNLAIAPNGRWAAMGVAPASLWDLASKTKVADLGPTDFSLFSPDGRYLASVFVRPGTNGAERSDLVVYDVPSGAVAGRVDVTGAVYDLAWKPDSSQFVYAGNGVGPTIYDLHQRRVVRRAVAPGKRIVRGVVWTAQNQIITGQAVVEELLVWNGADLTMERHLPGVNWSFHLGQTADSRYVVALDNTRTLSVFDTRTWERREMKVPAWGSRIVTHPTRPIVLIAERASEQQSNLMAIDVSEMRVVGTLEGVAQAYAFGPHGDSIYVDQDDKLAVLSTATFKPQTQVEVGAGAPQCAEADAAHKRLLVCDRKGVRVWDVAAARMTQSFSTPVDLLAGEPDAKGQYAGVTYDAAEQQSHLIGFDPASGRSSELTALPHHVTALAATANVLVLYATPDSGDPRNAAREGIVQAYDRSTMQPLGKFKLRLVTAPLQYQAATETGIETLALSPDGQRLAVVTRWVDGWRTGRVVSGQLRVYDVRSGKLLHTFEQFGPVRNVTFDGANTLAIRSDQFIYSYDIGKHQTNWQIPVQKGEVSLALAGNKGNVAYGMSLVHYHSTPDARPLWQLHNGDIYELFSFADPDTIVEITQQNEVRFWALNDWLAQGSK